MGQLKKKIILTLVLSVYAQVILGAENFLEKQFSSMTKFPRVEILKEITPVEQLVSLERHLDENKLIGRESKSWGLLILVLVRHKGASDSRCLHPDHLQQLL